MSITEFLSQGGYAFYIWGSYGLGLALLVVEVIQLRRQRGTTLSRVSRLARMRAEVEHEGQT